MQYLDEVVRELPKGREGGHEKKSEGAVSGRGHGFGGWEWRRERSAAKAVVRFHGPHGLCLIRNPISAGSRAPVGLDVMRRRELSRTKHALGCRLMDGLYFRISARQTYQGLSHLDGRICRIPCMYLVREAAAQTVSQWVLGRDKVKRAHVERLLPQLAMVFSLDLDSNSQGPMQIGWAKFSWQNLMQLHGLGVSWLLM